MKIRTLAALAVLMFTTTFTFSDPTGPELTEPEATVVPDIEGSIPVPNVPGLSYKTYEDGERIEIPFNRMIQLPMVMEGFWFTPEGKDSRLCVRMVAPLSDTLVGYIGYCFSNDELAGFPQVFAPATESVPGEDSF